MTMSKSFEFCTLTITNHMMMNDDVVAMRMNYEILIVS